MSVAPSPTQEPTGIAQPLEPIDYARARDLLRDPDAEDCERFASWFGHSLIERAGAADALVEAAYGLLAIIQSVCPEYDEAPVCAHARWAIAQAEGRS